MEPASSLEVLTVLAGRWGRAYRSARRDLHRLAASEDFPEVFALAARALQELGLVLKPTHRGALQHARKDVRDLVEALVQIADTFGTHVGPGAASSSPAVAPPVPPHTDPVFVQDPWASASAGKTSRSSQLSSGRAVTGVVREAPSDPWAQWASARLSLPSPQLLMGVCGDVPAEACEAMAPPCSSPTTGSSQVLAVVGSVADVVAFARASGFGHGIPPALEGPFAGGRANLVDDPRRLDCESLNGRAPTSSSAPRSAWTAPVSPSTAASCSASMRLSASPAPPSPASAWRSLVDRSLAAAEHHGGWRGFFSELPAAALASPRPGSWAPLGSPCVGNRIRVAQELSTIDEGLHIVIDKGTRGYISEIDDDGDLLIFFPSLADSINPFRWISSDARCKLEGLRDRNSDFDADDG
mmetsp:Transcript_11317/g.19993  ORF Transcript_11317/g.19993 Transcript_11317/m.19993 type:complete len:413 (-) Transcript_11317:237-1475(-)